MLVHACLNPSPKGGIERVVTRIQFQLPNPLYQRLKEIAEQQDCSLSEVMCKAAEHFITRFSENPKLQGVWRFPTLGCRGDFLTDPASLRPETDAIIQRTGS